jgi:hypothetical protein
LARGRPVPFIAREMLPGRRALIGLANGWARHEAAVEVD